MKLLLCKNVSSLGIVGDVVEVSAGYARNYLVPHGLATEPTSANVRKVAKARREAEQELVRQREMLEAFGKRMDGVEITVSALSNEEGVLYGSVGAKEIAAALVAEGHPVEPEHVALEEPIRRLDNVSVEIKLTPDISSTIKLWVVRDKTGSHEDEDELKPGTEAGSDGNGSDE